MDLTKCKKFLKEDTYAHCTICANFRNSNSFAHRKSELHQKKLNVKLRKISYFLKQKLKKPIILHDEEWSGKNTQRFCHFCGCNYDESYKEEEFIVENLGCLYHHASSQHLESVKSFLKKNFRTEDPGKYSTSKKDLDRYLEKLPEEKRRYLKKMDILNDMILKQIKVTEEERKKIVEERDELETSNASCSYQLQSSTPSTEKKRDEIKSYPMFKNKDHTKIPPWLEDVPADSSSIENKSSAPVIGPTMDTLIKHVASQKKKGLSKNRIGANFMHLTQGSSKWLPSFQGVWNKGRRKQQQINFNRKNKTSRA